ncbi:3-deoxy-7-phosphoheptulonate synthase [Micromonospora sp. HUAS LYJ1]|uniref:3-deoxy-7-phosphoheptulonate synthase n=1 Tax=Micromonospora sp. HUAS LYJ1 TaxID=3061626 RepID=UPI0026738B80|nr:3-deoxy-7-phosphoheptulonate synthase [Micromonospora sp. HUAS LYJ1]WKU07153.1 3-deoxy-7-phosphoheptulonate synthase [Micromonospora sp. HUAS LYJ1]
MRTSSDTADDIVAEGWGVDADTASPEVDVRTAHPAPAAGACASYPWRRLRATQQPSWSDQGVLRAVVQELGTRTPLVEPQECERLRSRLARVAQGEAFLLQAGDCAEDLSQVGPAAVRAKLSTMAQMAAILRAALGVEVVTVGRMAGQYAKPRTETREQRGELSLPAYRGDAVNGVEFHPATRAPDASRLLRAYEASAVTLAHMRQFAEEAGTGEVFSSHEALLLDYETALLRPGPAAGRRYASSASMIWIGHRTRELDGAHVEFARHVDNPIGVKVGPDATAEELLALARLVDPDRVPGRLTFIVRMGAAHVRRLLPPLVDAFATAGVGVGWVCDPMHGNTVRADGGRKTRRLADIIAEVHGFFEVHRSLGTWPGGLHLELTGEDVTECLGGSDEVRTEHLHQRYTTLCDPRLNRSQSVDLALALLASFG